MGLDGEMKQWATNQDGLDQLRMESAPIPSELKANEVLVKINSVSLNYRDTEVCMGLYGHHKSIQQNASLVPCSDAAGVVVKTGGAEADGVLAVGDRVMSIFTQSHLTGQILERDMATQMGLPLPGVLTQYRVFPASSLVRIPDGLSDDEASTLPIAAVTAWTSINWMRPIGQHLQGKENVVVFQGTGGVSIMGLQIAKACNLTAIVTSSSDAKLEKARQLGADHLINYKKNPEWHIEVLRLTEGRGADVILETGGSGTLNKSFECVAFGGLISCIGYLSGKEDAPGNRMNTNVLALKRNVTLKGILNGGKDRFEEMLAAVYQKQDVHPVVDKVFEFAQAKEALQYLFSGQHFGKVVVRVD